MCSVREGSGKRCILAGTARKGKRGRGFFSRAAAICGLIPAAMPNPEPAAAEPAAAPAKPRLAALIPCYREEGHVGGVVRGAREAGFDAIVVDDGSPDRTADEAREAGATEVVVHEVNRGKGAAMSTGLRRALELGYDAVVLMDGDGQHLPAELPRFAEAFAQGGADVVLGSRMADHRGMPLVRYCTNRYMSWLLSRRLGQRATDTQCGYRLLSRKAIPVVLAGGSSGFAADSEQLLLLARAGFRFREVPVSTVYGDERSKIHPVRDTLRFFAMLRKYR